MTSPPTAYAPARSDVLAGRLWIVAAAVLWSSSGLFAKADIFADWPIAGRGILLAFWRAVFAAAVLWPCVRRPRWRRSLVPLTLSFTAMNATYLSAMGMTTAANAIWLQSTCPWWVFLVSVTLLGQTVVRRDLIPLVFAALGVGLILAFELQGGQPAGVTLGLTSGLFFGLVVIFMSRLSGENSPWLVALCHTVAALCLLPWVIYLGVWPTPRQLAVLAGFGSLQMAVPYLCLLRGLRSVSSQEAVAIGLLEPVLLPLWVFLAWHEMPAWWTTAGATLILVGLVCRYLLLGKVLQRI